MPRDPIVRQLRVVVAIGATLSGIACAHGTSASAPARTRARADTATLRRAVDTVLDSIRSARHLPGATVAIVLHDGARISRASGMADVERGVAMRTSTRMSTGSTGKTFVAALVLRLAERNRLSLDAPIATWLGHEPWFDSLPNGRGLTLRHLLSHRSGLVQHWFENPAFSRWIAAIRAANPDSAVPPDSLVRGVIGTKPLFPPGEGFHYSDMNYVLAGLILERVEHATYYAQLARDLTGPLGLHDTEAAIVRRFRGLASGYMAPPQGGGASPKSADDGAFAANPAAEWTGGGLVSSSNDLATWFAALFGGRVLSRPSLALMTTVTGRGTTMGIEGYGMGMEILHDAGGALYAHTGYFPGFNTIAAFDPACRIALAIQVNRDYGNGPLERMAFAVLGAVRRASPAACAPAPAGRVP